MSDIVNDVWQVLYYDFPFRGGKLQFQQICFMATAAPYVDEEIGGLCRVESRDDFLLCWEPF
jgi:hypothetical protein